jgi:transcription-repair coupling factor (superfamily II helicase)
MAAEVLTRGPEGLLDNLLPSEVLAEGVARLETALTADPTGGGGVLSGLRGAAGSLLLATWFRRVQRPALVITPDRETAQQLADDLETWLGPGPVVYLPQQEVLAFDRKSPDPALTGAFLHGLDLLAERTPRLAVTSLYGARQRVISPQRLAGAVLEVAVGQRWDRDELCRNLAHRGYRPAGMVARPGDYARRGGLLDVFAPGGSALRIEFFDDEVVSLRAFDVETQRSSDRLSQARIVPVSHLILDDEALLNGLAWLEEALARDELDQDEHDDLAARFEERLPGEGLESYLPCFEPTALLLDHLPASAVVVWLEPVRLGVQSELLDDELPRLRDNRLQRDPLLPSTQALVAGQAELVGTGRAQVLLAASWLPGDTSGHWLGSKALVQVAFSTTRPDLRGGDVRRLRQELDGWEAEGDRVLLLCDNAGQARRLAELLEESDGGPPANQPAVGPVSGGFHWPEFHLHCITDHELFERYRRPARVRHKSAGVLKDQRSLKPGEFVVHLEYGIGLYRGLRQITVEGTERECLLIEYAEGGKVYVPVEKIDQVERYSSDREARPTLDRLGTATWQRVTKRARKAIRAMAAELIELYAVRQALPGFAFPADSSLQRELEDSFIYEETPDQLACISEIKRDMETSRPMDRLVCGDVGYGKTEVAMRAAFKTVSSGRQVAVLCPTTLLASQHGETFAERFRDFPVRVATLSRFRSPKEQREIVHRVAAGEVDILIGTHRLLSRDVKFANLGLLIVDEEHRFGVRHKERIKELRRLVDVLTLSATPIPRTLYMALMGARDMSLINTPPRDRLPIHTELCTFDPGLLTEAVLRELHRGGQVFFVHNRVETIESTAQLIRELLPHVRIAVAHGQMREAELERIMRAFLAHEYDMLVATAIIESGLDMPRVNTIIIDRADRVGLAQLYQLRGRVGRSSHRAFAYLMTPPGERLTLEARRRLAALEEFQALGSGYHIAMRDLEIRGAGNLLGEEQHGHMEAIGFDLYCRLLEETVAELRGGEGVPPLDVKVDLQLAAYLPDDYVGDAEQKMDLYRRLARLREPSACEWLREELRDRYGVLPAPVENLVTVHEIRLLAGRNGVEEIRAGRKGLDFFFAGAREPSPTIIRGLMAAGPRGLAFKAIDQFIMSIPATRDQFPAAALAAVGLLERLRRAEAA